MENPTAEEQVAEKHDKETELEAERRKHSENRKVFKDGESEQERANRLGLATP